MTAFTADAARALTGQDDLRARRAEAADQFATSPLPSTDEEVWRYSRIADLDLDAYVLPAELPAGVGLPGELAGPLSVVPSRAATVVTVNGRVASVEVNDPDVQVLTGDAVGAADL